MIRKLKGFKTQLTVKCLRCKNCPPWRLLGITSEGLLVAGVIILAKVRGFCLV